MIKDKLLSEFQGRELSRQKVRIRDDFTCQWCGREWGAGRRLDVHHIDGDNNKSKKYDNEDEWNNMITLCHGCHYSLPQTKREISRSNGGQMFSNETKYKKLIKRINDYFKECIVENSKNFEQKLNVYRKNGRKRNQLNNNIKIPQKIKYRNRIMKQLKDNGYTYKTIGEMHSLSSQKVSEIIRNM